MDIQQKDNFLSCEIAQDFSNLNLAPDSFHPFYVKFINLRFPMMVAQLLELRYLINHTVDGYTEPPLTPDYRQFRESLQGALESFSIHNRRYCERMLKILSMFRDIHYKHSVISRDAEQRLRDTKAKNRAKRLKSIRYGLFCVLVGVGSGILWLAIPDSSWAIKLLPAIYGYLSWYYFHKLPGLDREHEKLTSELNDVLRRRVNSLNWKTLIHKLALVLGYKRVPGVEVFHNDNDHMDRSAYH